MPILIIAEPGSRARQFYIDDGVAVVKLKLLAVTNTNMINMTYDSDRQGGTFSVKNG